MAQSDESDESRPERDVGAPPISATWWRARSTVGNVVTPSQISLYQRNSVAPKVVELAPGENPNYARQPLEGAHQHGIQVILRVLGPSTGEPTEL